MKRRLHVGSGVSTDPRNRSVAIAKDAIEYLQAAELIASPREADEYLPIKLMKPTLFLVCQRMELGLKAVLVSEGWTDEGLKKIGHRLRAAADACERTGLTFSSEIRAVIDGLNGYHEQNVFRYHRTGMITVPLPADLVAFVEPEIHRLTSLVFDRVRRRLRAEA